MISTWLAVIGPAYTSLMLMFFSCLPTREWPIPSTSHTSAGIELSPGQWIFFAQGSSLLIGHVCSKPSTSSGRRRLRSLQALRYRPSGLSPLVAQWVKSLPAVQETQVRFLGRSPGEGNGSPLQHSCLESPMNGEAWQATVHGVTKSRT